MAIIPRIPTTSAPREKAEMVLMSPALPVEGMPMIMYNEKSRWKPVAKLVMERMSNVKLASKKEIHVLCGVSIVRN